MTPAEKIALSRLEEGWYIHPLPVHPHSLYLFNPEDRRDHVTIQRRTFKALKPKLTKPDKSGRMYLRKVKS